MAKRTKAELEREIADLRAQLAAAADRENALMRAEQGREEGVGGDRGAELTRQESGAGKVQVSGEEKDREIEGAKSLQAGGNREGEKDGLLDKLDSTKKRRLLQHYINSGGQVYKSCRFAGIHPQTHYNWLANDPDYKAAYAVAQERSLDVIEQEIIRRGVKGFKEPIIYQGKVTGHVRRYSDNLLMFLAKRRDPLYRDNPQLALGLKAGGDIRVHLNVPRPGQEPSASEKKRPKVQIDPAIDVEARELPE